MLFAFYLRSTIVSWTMWAVCLMLNVHTVTGFVCRYHLSTLTVVTRVLSMLVEIASLFQLRMHHCCCKPFKVFSRHLFQILK